METRASKAGILSAFLAVYVIWGATYLAIRFAVETLPPFLMAATRWIVPGVALYAWHRARGAPRPTLAQWGAASVVGALLIVGGNGTVSWAAQHIPSGLTALLIAVVPVWIALLEWAGPRRVKPTMRASAGIALGLVGVALLVSDKGLTIGSAGLMGLVSAGLVVFASLAWATGSLYSRRAPRPPDLLHAASMQMLAGGVILGVLGLATGEVARVDLAAASVRSWISLGFLIVFGSVVAYSSYVWLLQVTRAELVATYAFVNPVVAVILGLVLGGEPFTPRTMLVAALVVVAVALVVTAPRPKPTVDADRSPVET